MCILVDTNVWLDLFLPGRPHEGESRLFLERAMEADACLVYPGCILKDVFYLIASECKRLARQEKGELSHTDAVVAQQYAWGCIEIIQELAVPIDMGLLDIRKATIWRRSNTDFEDNLVRAAAERSKADLVVTWDKGMLAKCFVPTVTPVDAIAELEARALA